MSEQTTEVQRALIITCGPLAQTSGELFTELLHERRGPALATAVVPLTTAAPDDAFATAVTAALTAISPPDLAVRLAHSGWKLEHTSEIALFVVMDTAPPDAAAAGDEKAAALLSLAADLVFRHLGVETRSLHIWLAGEETEANANDCLNGRLPATRGIIALSLRNSAGLRLPGAAALTGRCAELLWALTATPLRRLPEYVTEHNQHAYADNLPLLTLGIAGWAWSPESVHAAFVRRWLDNILAAWLASPENPPSLEETAVWLAEQNLGAPALADCALTEKERQPPAFAPDMWRAPWPWRIPLLWQTLKAREEADRAGQTGRVQNACLRLAEPVDRITAVWRQAVQERLDRQPAAAIAWTCLWLDMALAEYNRQYEQTWDEAAAQEETDNMLAEERGQLEADMRRWLESWPQSDWQSWLEAALRPWRWPRLIWLYSRWQRFGPRLNRLLQQQAERRRQQAVQTAARQALGDLEKSLRRLQSQVEEIRDMLHCLAAEADAAFPALPNNALPDARPPVSPEPQLPIAPLPFPASLYCHLIPDDAAESLVAAAYIGGLGRQLDALDDTILAGLLNLGRQRLGGVWQLTAVDVFTAVTSDDDQREAWWQALWQSARPLWRVDEARLSEAERAGNSQMAGVSGASTDLLAGLLPGVAEPLHWLPSADRERILLVRAQRNSAADFAD